MSVLIADDDPISRRLLEVSLSNAGYPVSTVANGTDALRLLEKKDGPRLAILDWMMPDVDGVDVCKMIRQSARELYVYMILLTARGRQSEIVQGLEAGADDYMTKPFDMQELKARLRAGMRILELQEQLVHAREESLIQASHDSLTGLLNHVAILSVLERELSRAVREGVPVGVMMADIDYFKSVNDNHGHAAGDAVLRETAQKMMGTLRPYDSIGRYGGEEFVVVVPGCSLEDTARLAERLREFVCGQPISTPDGTIPITMSIGVAASWDQAKPGQILRAADEALYSAKGAGRNRVASSSNAGRSSIRQTEQSAK